MPPETETPPGGVRSPAAPTEPAPGGGAAAPSRGGAAGATAVVVAAAAFAALLAAVRLSDVPDLDAGDQEKNAQYLLHAWTTGEWVLPREQGTILPTKPPLQTWLAGLAALVTGGPDLLALRLPSAAAGVALAALTAHLGILLGGRATGLVAGLAVAANPLFLKLSAFARPDMVLCLSIVAAFWSWTCLRLAVGPRWFHRAAFWLSLAAGTLAKGPVGPAVVLLGVALHLWWSRRPRAFRSLRPAVGSALLLLAVAAWAGPALLRGGRELVDVLLVDEIVQRSVNPGARGARPHGAGAFLAESLGRFLPWTLLLPAAAIALAPGLRAAREHGASLRGPALPASWLAAALVVFLLPAQKRADYAMAFLPAAALLVGLLAGRAATGTWTARATAGAGVLVLLVAAAGAAAAAGIAPDPGDALRPLRESAAAPGARAAVWAAVALAAAGGAGLAGGRRVAGPTLLAGAVLAGAVAERLRPDPERDARAARAAFLRALGETAAAGGGSAAVFLAGEGRGDSSTLYHLGRAEPPLRTADEVRARAAAVRPLWIVTGERGAAVLETAGLAMREHAADAPENTVLLRAVGR